MKKVVAFFTMCLIFVNLFTVGVSASSLSQDGVITTLNTDKEEYNQGEQIIVTLIVENVNDIPVSNVTLEGLLPEGFEFVSGENAKETIAYMERGEIVSLKYTLVNQSADIGSKNSVTDVSTPDTGDYFNLSFLIVLVIIIVSVVIYIYLLKDKQRNRFLSIILCIVLVGSLFGDVLVEAYASDIKTKSIDIKTSVKYVDESIQIEAIVAYETHGQVDEFENIDEESFYIDSDNDSLSDGIEQFLYTNKYEEDTDDDGLTDGVEIAINSDPTVADTDSDGTLDGNEDFDNDGIINLVEIKTGIDPVDYDSDNDGLNDNDELYVYYTFPLNNDTDGDGARDGWEVMHGYNPTVIDELFDIYESDSDENLEVELNMQVSGSQISTLLVEEVTDSPFIDETIPGYIGPAYDFTIEGVFEEAKISFTFDEELLKDSSFIPTIYYFNEETQLLEEQFTIVEGNVAYTTVTHFSTYILLNKTAFDLVWENEIKKPIVSEDGTSSNIDVVFVIDASNSMNSYGRMKAAKKSIYTFVNALGEEDRAALVRFDTNSSILNGLTTDKETILSLVDSLEASGGTAMYSGFEEAIDLLTDENENYGYKMIVILSDGKDDPKTTYDGYYASMVERAVSNNIVVYTIGAGTSTDTAILSKVALATEGAYYSATVTSGIGNSFEEIRQNTIDLVTDSNNDGISDYFTKLLCDGTLRLGTGKYSPFYGASYEDVQANMDGDFDDDGVLDGAEIKITFSEELNRVYAFMFSNPLLLDSDYDGINDSLESSQNRYSNNFEADVKYKTGDNRYDTSVEFKVDYSMFFDDNTVYKQELGVLASLLALDMYDDGWLEITDGTIGNTEETNGVSYGELFGLSDCVNYDTDDLATLYASEYNGNQVDKDDVSEVFIGHRLVNYNGQQREIIFLAVRGTNGTQSEWSSNFDIGADTDAYYAKTGQHPDWICKENHKGFDVTANRILNAYNEYIDNLVEEGKINNSIEKGIFITGHSRGAAIANLLGAHFEDDPDYDSYTYTMASPYTTTKSNAASYDTIFNIINDDDMVTYLPLEKWGFYRYGEDLVISVKDSYEDSSPFGNSVNTFEYMFKAEYDSNNKLDDCINAFFEMTSNREDYYVLDYLSGDGNVMEGGVHFWESAFDDFVELIEIGKLDKYCSITKTEHLVGYTISVTYCPAYAAQIIANLAAKDDIKEKYEYGIKDWLSIDLKGKYSKARTIFAEASGKIPVIGATVGGMECPHMPGTYYLITKNTEYCYYE